MSLADLIDSPPKQHKHQGTCCWLRRYTRDRGAEWRGQIDRLLAMTEEWPHKDLADALTSRGVAVGSQAVYRHRARVCHCCRMAP